ncbi:hypothetical protein [Streptomyces sp. CB02400]|uniref:hypothetical protein n=1 Tax=Streptomyces sp. CB02400 TaxID=1703944 RepID=UPI00142FE721|nr:hypothetical protein [Streptomyces sp. CB02400]
MVHRPLLDLPKPADMFDAGRSRDRHLGRTARLLQRGRVHRRAEAAEKRGEVVLVDLERLYHGE